MKKERIWIDTAIRKRQPFNFKTNILGFHFFKINEWEHKIFEVQYTTGNKQNFFEVKETALKEIYAQYGKENVIIKGVYDTFITKSMV